VDNFAKINGASEHSNSIYAVIIGYFANLAIPRIGEVTRCTSLNQVEGVPLNKLFGTVILERIIDFFLLIAIFIVATIIFAQEFIDFVSGLLSEKLKNGSFLSLIGGGLLSLVLIFILMFVYRNKLKGTKFFGKVIGFLSGIKEGIKSASKIKNKTNFIFHTAFIWLMYFLMIYVCFFSIPETSNLTAYDCIFVMVASGLGMVAPVQGGIGVYHMLVASALVVLGIKPLIDLATNQVISDPGLVFATIIHSCQTIMIVLFGAISFILLTINKKKFDRIEATIS